MFLHKSRQIAGVIGELLRLVMNDVGRDSIQKTVEAIRNVKSGI